MSNETDLWLNTQTRQGFASVFGPAWHFVPELAALCDSGTNTFDGPVPLAEVEKLVNFRILSVALQGMPYTHMDTTGVYTGSMNTDKFRALVASDTSEILQVRSADFQVHQYPELIDIAARLIGDPEAVDKGVQIRSAGLLRNRCAFWVQFVIPTPAGVSGMEVWPYITVSTSIDGVSATQISHGGIATVCDNTLAISLMDRTIPRVKIKHTKNSPAALANIAETLGIMDHVGKYMDTILSRLAETKVSESQWNRFVEIHFPVPAGDSIVGKAVREEKVKELTALYIGDDRVKPWRGTALGVFQAVNTMNHWTDGVKIGRQVSTGKLYRASLNMVTGAGDDARIITEINQVLKESKKALITI